MWHLLATWCLELIIWITQPVFIRFSNYKLIFHPLVLNKTGEQELACSSTSIQIGVESDLTLACYMVSRAHNMNNSTKFWSIRAAKKGTLLYLYMQSGVEPAGIRIHIPPRKSVTLMANQHISNNCVQANGTLYAPSHMHLSKVLLDGRGRVYHLLSWNIQFCLSKPGIAWNSILRIITGLVIFRVLEWCTPTQAHHDRGWVTSLSSSCLEDPT